MALDFDGVNQYLSRTAAVIAAAPLTIACWFKAESDPGFNKALVGFGASSGSGDYFQLIAALGTSGNPISFAASASASAGTAMSSTGMTVGTWHHACGIERAANDRSAYIDGGSRGDNATSKTPAGVDRSSIAAMLQAVAGSYFDGKVAEVGIWNAALSDAEVAILALGFAPPLVRPASLVAYWPILGRLSTETDIKGGNDLTLNNSPANADHPRIIYRVGMDCWHAPPFVPKLKRSMVVVN